MKKALLFIMLAFFLAGCSREPDGIAYSPIVCEYSTTPTFGTAVHCISTNMRVYADNTVEVYCGGFYDRNAGEDGISVDYIYGQKFEITEVDKQSIIAVIKRNNISELSDCGDEDSCDGSYSYIFLFDENGEQVHSCGGLNPDNNRYRNVVEAVTGVLPEGAWGNVREAATESLVEYLLENYPEDYEWLEDGEEFN